MKAVIRNPRKEVLPRFDANAGPSDTHQVHVQVDVDFIDDHGVVQSSQTYHRLPAEFDMSEFDRQAQAMQNDLDNSAANKDHIDSGALADKIIEQLKSQSVPPVDLLR